MALGMTQVLVSEASRWLPHVAVTRRALVLGTGAVALVVLLGWLMSSSGEPSRRVPSASRVTAIQLETLGRLQQPAPKAVGVRAQAPAVRR